MTSISAQSFCFRTYLLTMLIAAACSHRRSRIKRVSRLLSAIACAMATPLDWLGGDEREIALSLLAGSWLDENGSTYHLFCSSGLSLDVLTVRPTGRRLFTKSLIRNIGGCVLWGSAAKAFLLHMDGDHLQWTRGEQRFIWTKLQ